jgi:hypothetical protein
MREMDESIAPALAEAEKIAREYLAKEGLGPSAGAKGEAKAPVPARVACAACGAPNDDDAAFCKKCGAAMRGAEAKSATGEGPRETEGDATS